MSSLKSLIGKDKCPSPHVPIQRLQPTNTDNLKSTRKQRVNLADTSEDADDEEVRKALLQVSSC